MNIFQGGFLGLDNIGVFDRSAPLPTGGYIEQSDGTSWMAMYTPEPAGHRAGTGAGRSGLRRRRQQVLGALPLHRPRHEPSRRRWHGHCGTKRTASSTTCCTLPDGRHFPHEDPLHGGLIPLFAVETLEPELLDRLPGFKRRLEWFIENRPDLTDNVACMTHAGQGRAPAAVDRRSAISCAASSSTCWMRTSSSRRTASARCRGITRTIPTCCNVNGMEHRVDYEPAESTHRAVRRQLQLARPDLVPGQLSAGRVAAEVPPLPRR